MTNPRVRALSGEARPEHRRFAAPLISAFIALTLLTQLCVSLVIFPVFHHLRKTWPFLDYPMYSRARYEGDRIPDVHLLATRDDTSELPMTAADLGIGPWDFRILQRAVLAGNHRLVASFVEHYERAHDTTIRSLRIADRGRLLTKAGLEPAPEPEILLGTLVIDRTRSAR